MLQTIARVVRSAKVDQVESTSVDDGIRSLLMASEEPKVESDKVTILVIDDELGPRESLRILLNREYDVHCASGVDEGVALLKEHHPELVIMDIRMPGKSGIEGLREFRALDSEVSIVMLTGYGALETAQQALRLGANDYINKPFDTGEMMAVVERYTEQTRMERRRRAMLKELHDMNAHLMEDLADKDSMASLGQSSAEFAHDLRNPLMIVSGYVDLLARQLDKAQDMIGGEYDSVSEYLGIIENNVRRCSDLATMWQKMGSGDLTNFTETSLDDVVDDLMMGVEPLVSTAGVNMEYRVNTGGGKVNGNRAQLLRALHNVIANAIDAVPEGSGQILFSCQREESIVVITVKDNGSGMPPDVVERMFEPYFTTKEKSKGTGLGTVITRRIVEDHGGTVAVKSEPGCGTLFTINLPLANGAKPA